jgi:cholesterol oxidase
MVDQPEHVDVVVVGSGFGGSVAAYRLAEAGHRVVVLERGKAFPPGSFPRDPAGVAANFWDPAGGRHGMFDIWSFQGLEAVVASGLGGGSLVYANVLIRKDERWFVREQPIPGGGYETWPVTRSDLDPHYDRVEAMLGARRYPYPDTTPKTAAMREAAHRAGLDWDLPLLAVSFGATPDGDAVPGAPLAPAPYGNVHGVPRRACVLCGECDIGCNDGSKNTLDHTYLSAAAHHGADLRTRHEVRGIAPRPGGGYLVRYVVHDDESEGVPTAVDRLPVRALSCDRLVLAAGTLGTTMLLLRNRSAFPGLSPALGSRFSGNGDLLGLLIGATDAAGRPRRLEGSRGPVITSRVRIPDAADTDGPTEWPPPRGHYVEDAGYPVLAEWLVELARAGGLTRRGAAFARTVLMARLQGENRSSVSRDLATLIGGGDLAVSSLPLLGMGRDIPDGVMRIRDGQMDVDWTTLTSADFISGVRSTMRTLAAELGADYVDNPLWRLHRVITVHPLGGAPMAEDPALGVCDPFGRVYGFPGLYVVDGAVMPGAVGPNPSLTIAALADRTCDSIAEEAAGVAVAVGAGVAPPPARETVSPPPPQAVPVARSTRPRTLRFTEKMAGWVAWGETDPVVGAGVGRARDEPLWFRLTIVTDDLDRFVADPEHEGRATGVLYCDTLGGECEVLRGWFNLFTVGADASRRAMRYRLHVEDAGGNPVTLIGMKDVHDDAGLDVWSDTTTLYVRLYQGHLDEATASTAEPIAAGVITISPPAFARQLTTFRVRGPRRVAALAAFNRLFLGQVWTVYARRARPGAAAPGRST